MDVYLSNPPFDLDKPIQTLHQDYPLKAGNVNKGERKTVNKTPESDQPEQKKMVQINLKSAPPLSKKFSFFGQKPAKKPQDKQGRYISLLMHYLDCLVMSVLTISRTSNVQTYHVEVVLIAPELITTGANLLMM